MEEKIVVVLNEMSEYLSIPQMNMDGNPKSKRYDQCKCGCLTGKTAREIKYHSCGTIAKNIDYTFVKEGVIDAFLLSHIQRPI